MTWHLKGLGNNVRGNVLLALKMEARSGCVQDEVVLLLRRQSKGFARGPAKYRGVGVVKQRVTPLCQLLTSTT